MRQTPLSSVNPCFLIAPDNAHKFSDSNTSLAKK